MQLILTENLLIEHLKPCTNLNYNRLSIIVLLQARLEHKLVATLETPPRLVEHVVQKEALWRLGRVVSGHGRLCVDKQREVVVFVFVHIGWFVLESDGFTVSFIIY